MNKYTLHNNIMILSIVFILLVSTLMYPIAANPGNDPGNNNGNSENNMNSPSQEPNGQGSQNEDSGNNNQGSESGNEGYTQVGNGNVNQSQGEEDGKGNSHEGDDDTNQDGQGNQNQEQNQHQKRNGDNDGDNISDDKERYHYRKMTMIQGENQTRIHSEWQQDNKQDFFEIFFTIKNGPKILFEYMSSSNTSNNNLSFEILFKNLFEYFDDNDNGRYDQNDTILESYSLINTSFNEINYSKIISDDGEPVSVIQTSTIDNIFTIVIYVSGNYSQIQNQILSPSEIKIDFIITNFEFSENNSFLSFETELQTIHTIDMNSDSFDEKQGYGKNEQEINISSINHNGFFSWIETAIIDNNTHKVNVTMISSIEQTLTDEGKEILKTNTIYFCYPQGKNIVHDPKIGIASVSFNAFTPIVIQTVFSSNNILVYLGVCIIASFLFIGTIFARKRI